MLKLLAVALVALSLLGEVTAYSAFTSQPAYACGQC
jgi:hypothetical protein